MVILLITTLETLWIKLILGFDIKLDGESKSSALINIETDFGMKEFIFDKIGKIAAEKDLLMINEV